MRVLAAFLLLSVLAIAAFAQEKPAQGEGAESPEAQALVTDRDIADIPLVRAEEDCPNWAWAAAVEAVLRSSGVTEYPQEYWMDKMYGGTVCLDKAGDTERLIKVLEGEYVLEDGKHIRIAATYTPGLPVNASDLLIPLLHNRVQIVFIDGKAMLFTGARWEDVLKPIGDRNLTVKELRFDDLTRPAGQRRLALNPESADLSQIQGIFRIDVAVIQTQN